MAQAASAAEGYARCWRIREMAGNSPCLQRYRRLPQQRRNRCGDPGYIASPLLQRASNLPHSGRTQKSGLKLRSKTNMLGNDMRRRKGRT